MAKQPGSGKWVLTGRTVGGGGQGSVRVVRRAGAPDDSPAFAMKALRNTESAQARARFRREVEAIQTIDDDRIIKVVDFDIEAADPFYVMEFHENVRPLDKIIFSEDSHFRSDPHGCLSFIAECADALEKAHAKVIHRDLKPANILVNAAGRPLIIDFGLCLPIGGDQVITFTDEGVGSQNYMAPECESGAEGEIRPNSDVYSLGKILWCMAAGQRAFARERPAFSHKRLSKLRPERPEYWHLTDLLARSVRSRPESRFKTAAEFAAACRHARDELVGKVHHLEWIGGRCSTCGSKSVRDTLETVNTPFKVDPWLLVGTHSNHPKVVPRVCTYCGSIALRNVDPVNAYLEKLENLEK